MEDYDIIFKKSYKNASNFFNIKIKGIKFEIIKDIKALSLELGRKKVPWYAVGFYKDNKLIILDKELFPQKGHKKDEFEGVILHELCHIFIKKIVEKKIPVWVEEGLCQYISFVGNLKPKKIVNLEGLNTYNDWYKLDHPYAYCSAYFSYLNKTFGKEKIILFLNLLNKFNTKNAFKKAFGKDLFKEELNFRETIK